VKRRTLTLILAAITALAVCIGGGAAYGYFTPTGSGTGAARTATMATVTLASITSETPNTLLEPGSTGEVIVKVTNPNSYTVHLVSVLASGTIGVSGGSGCTSGNSGVTFTNQPVLSIAIAASTTTLVRLAGAAAMSPSSANGCQGATFSIPVTIQVHTP
jgi:hypothetical protein